MIVIIIIIINTVVVLAVIKVINNKIKIATLMIIVRAKIFLTKFFQAAFLKITFECI